VPENFLKELINENESFILFLHDINSRAPGGRIVDDTASTSPARQARISPAPDLPALSRPGVSPA
jgi:hypothetical protein